MSRPRPTLADYVVIAISPVLIMTLVGSLVFFLLNVFYQGQFETRLNVIMALFVMAAVLIGRISIEEGREHAALFAIPLGIVTLVALCRFVQFQGGLAPFSPLINLTLIGLIWFCADRLTWDCTVIDESKDASGEGLLQTIGMEGSGQATGDSRDVDLEATTSHGDDSRPQQPRGLWKRFVESRRRPHPHGAWVIYFSLAALPLFGIGQWFIQAGDLASRRYVFKLLVVYVASALGLLLTTSFLGLRRYLRQRRLEMPGEMAGVWMGVGATMIVALLLACMLLPRRNPEYSVTHLPLLAGSRKDLVTSRFGFGHDGPQQADADRPGDQPPEKGSDAARDAGQKTGGNESRSPRAQDDPPSKGDAGRSDQNSDSRDAPSDERNSREASTQGQSSPDNSKQGKSSQGQSSPDNSTQSKSSPDHSTQSKSSQDNSTQSKTSHGKSGQGNSTPGKTPGEEAAERRSGAADAKESREGNQAQRPDRDTSNERTDADRQAKEESGRQAQNRTGEEKSTAQEQPDGKPSDRPSGTDQGPRSNRFLDATRALSQFRPGLGGLVKLIYWAVVILVVGYLLWRYRSQVLNALQNFFQSLRDLWNRLFGGWGEGPAADQPAAAGPVQTPPRPFSAYPDPFLTGMAERWSPDELVKYSFEALEAWARERGCPRAPDQTPYEFARRVAARETSLGKDVVRLSELYNVSAYAQRTVPPSGVSQLRRLWEALRAPAAA